MCTERMFAALAGLLAVALGACASTAGLREVQALPGLRLTLPADAVRDAAARGIDSEVARFEGRGWTLLVARGLHEGLPSDPGWGPAGHATVAGRRFDAVAGPRPGEALPAGVAIVEDIRPQWTRSGDAFEDTAGPRLALHLHCRDAGLCRTIAARLLAGLRPDPP